jgi:hypothetical protein
MATTNNKLPKRHIGNMILSFQAIGSIKKLEVEDARYDIRVHQEQ